MSVPIARRGKWHRRAVWPFVPLIAFGEAVRIGTTGFLDAWRDLAAGLREHRQEETNRAEVQ